MIYSHTPCLGGDKRMHTRSPVVFLMVGAGGMCMMCVHFLFSLTGHYLNLELKPKDGMAISITFTWSLPVSALKKTIVFHLSILNALPEKKKGISAAEDNPESS